jgi:hypothetical protein
MLLACRELLDFHEPISMLRCRRRMGKSRPDYRAERVEERENPPKFNLYRVTRNRFFSEKLGFYSADLVKLVIMIGNVMGHNDDKVCYAFNRRSVILWHEIILYRDRKWCV